jgi:hypothetical protein
MGIALSCDRLIHSYCNDLPAPTMSPAVVEPLLLADILAFAANLCQRHRLPRFRFPAIMQNKISKHRVKIQ